MLIWLGVLLVIASLLAGAGYLWLQHSRPEPQPEAVEASGPTARERVHDLLTTALEILGDHSSELRRFERTLDNRTDTEDWDLAFENGVEQVRLANRQVEEGMESTVATIDSDFKELLNAERQQMVAYKAKTDDLASTLENVEGDTALTKLAGQLVDMVRELREDNRTLRAEVKTARETTIELLERTRAAEEGARIDALTKLPNRRAFDEELSKCESTLKKGVTFSVIFMDIDHFKLVNDRYGHAAGDAVLSMVGRVLRDQRRTSDLVSRLGGEEFGVLLPKCSQVPARTVAEQYRKKLEASTLRYHGCEISITTSCGVAEAVCGESSSRLLERADVALYAAKSKGRNCVCMEPIPQIEETVEAKLPEEAAC